MGFSKVIELGDKGALSVTESEGVAVVKISVGASLGGGQAAGAVKVVASAEIDLEAAQLAQLGLDLLKSKLPESLQGLVSDLEAVAIPALKKA